MKKLIIAWLLLCGGASFAQRETDTIWRQQINEVFQNIDKKRIPEGLLLDYAMEFTNVPAYNGKLTDSTFVDLQVFGNIYKTLYMAQADTDTLITQNFPKIQDVSQSWMMLRKRYNDTDPGTVVLGGLFYQYNKISLDAKSQNKIGDDGKKYYDVFDNGMAKPIRYPANRSFRVASKNGRETQI